MYVFIRHCQMYSIAENTHSSSMLAYIMVFQHLETSLKRDLFICMESFMEIDCTDKQKDTFCSTESCVCISSGMTSSSVY